jgi:hypothetical protein
MTAVTPKGGPGGRNKALTGPFLARALEKCDHDDENFDQGTVSH